MKNLKAIIACLIFVWGQFLPPVAMAQCHPGEGAGHCEGHVPNFNPQCMRGMNPGCAGGPRPCFHDHPHFFQPPTPVTPAPTPTQTVSTPPPAPPPTITHVHTPTCTPHLVDQCRAMSPRQFWRPHNEPHEFAHPNPTPNNINQTAGIPQRANCAHQFHDAHEAYCAYINALNSGNLTRAFPHMHEHAFVRINHNGEQVTAFPHHEMNNTNPSATGFRSVPFHHHENPEINNVNTQISSVRVNHYEHLENGTPCQFGRNNYSRAISHENALAIAGSTTANGAILGTTNISNTFGLDLNSTIPVIPADISHSMTILVGGTLNASGNIVGARQQMTVDPGQLLTPAQYAALQQVVGTGQQTLVVNYRGAASGGLLALAANQTPDTLSSAFIPRGVVLNTIGFNAADSLHVTGAMTVLGSVVALQTTANTASAFGANSLFVGTRGSITDSLSNQSLMANFIASGGLNLNVINSIVNAGTISSIGILSIQSGGSINNISTPTTTATMSGTTVNLTSGTGTFSNSGHIVATAGNVNFYAPANRAMNLTNIGGTVRATQNINLRDACYAQTANMTVTSGDWFSKHLNLNSGLGTVNADLGKVTGRVNTTAANAHISADTPDLYLGNTNVVADPSFFNTGGSVTIGTDLEFHGQALAIVAKTNILTAPGAGIISTNSNSGNGGTITMIAGANFTSDGAASGSNNSADTLTVTGGTAEGGYIDLSGNISGSGVGITALDSTSTAFNGNGGNVNLVAYGGTAASAGQISLPTNVTVTTGGQGAGTNGNVTVISDAQSGTGVSMGAVNTGTATGGGGHIGIYTAIPVIFSGTGTMTIKDGAITNGASFGTMNAGSAAAAITTGDLTTAGGSVTVNAGTSLSTGSVSANGAGANGDGGSIFLSAAHNSAANLQVNGSLSANGVGSGNGGTIALSYNGSDDPAGALTVGTTVPSSNYISGNISADAGATGSTGGNINIASNAPNPLNLIINTATPLHVVNNSTISANGNTLGNANFNGQTLNVEGPGNINAVVNNNNDTGTVSYAVGAGNLTTGNISNASGDINVINNNSNGIITATQSIISAGLLNITASTGGAIVETTGNTLSGTSVFLLAGTGGITLQGTAGVSANSSTGNAGNITITADGGAIDLGGQITAMATGATGNGGNITIQGASFAANGDIDASSANAGNGGNISIETIGPASTLTINSGLLAQGGVSSGRGGTVTLATGTDLVITPAAAINVNSRAVNGNGGTISITSGNSGSGTIQIQQSLSANGTGSGKGGQILISANSNTPFLLSGASGNGVNGTLTAQGGSGGTISVINRGNGGITVLDYANISVAANAPGGNGGNITLNANSGLLTLPAGIIDVSANAGGTGNGGSVTLVGSSIALSGGSGTTLSVLANGSGNGNGGSISIRTTSATGDINLGLNSGNIAFLSATGGSPGSSAGNGGSITLNAARNLFIANTSILTVSPLGNNGNGGIIRLTNGSVTRGVMFIDQSLNANGSGNGSGGQVIISNNSNTVFLISGPSTNGINGIITANGGNGTGGSGGTISVTNRGPGGITLLSYSNISFTPSPGGGAGGSLTLNANNGLLTIPAGTINASAVGPGTYKGGSISLTGSSIVLNGGIGNTLSLLANGAGAGNGGSISVRTTSAAGNITLGLTAGSIAFASATGGSVGSSTGHGGSITFNAGGNLIIPNTPNIITVNPLGNNGNGGSISLIAGSASGAVNKLLQVDQSLFANGVGTGKGGTILVSYHDANNALIVGGQGPNSYINGGIFANAGNASGTGGTITITNSSSGPLTVSLLSNGNISADGANLGTINFVPTGAQPITVAGSALGNGNLVGIVNATGTSVYINPQAANSTLTVGTIGSTSSSGFVMLGVNNGNSTINIRGNLTTNGGALALLSSGNIGSSGAASTNTSSGSITMIAGAAFTPNQSTKTFTMTGRTSFGGSLNLGSLTSFSTAATSGNNNGGDITLIALGGSNPNAGTIIGPITTITTGGSGAGSNGNVTIISGADNSPIGLNLSNTSINTVGGSGGGGNVTLSVSDPILNLPAVIQSGKIIAGSFSTGILLNSPLTVGNIRTSTGNVSITSAGRVESGTLRTTSGNVFAYSSNTSDQSLSVGNVRTEGGYVILASNTLNSFVLPSSIITAGGAVSLVSGGTLRFSGSTSSIFTQGGSLTILSGVNFNVNGQTITVNGANNTDGSISISSGGTTLDTSNLSGKGGDVTIAAFAGTSGFAAINSQNRQLDIFAGGNSGNANGNVLVLAEESHNGITSNINDVITLGGSSAGHVRMAIASPLINGSALILNSGQITSGTLSAGTPQQGNLSLNNILTNVGNVVLSAGGNIDINFIDVSNVAVVSSNNITFAPGGGIITNGGEINLFAGAAFTNSGPSIFLTGASGTGGSINIGNAATFLTIGINPGHTGNITLVAFAGSAVNSGSIDSGNNPYTIIAANVASGASNNVLALAQNTTLGDVGTFLGNVTAAAGTPGLSVGGLTITDGAISAGKAIIVDTPTSSSNLTVLGSITAIGGDISLASANNISFTGAGNLLATIGGQINLIAGASFANTGNVFNIAGASANGGSISFANGFAISSQSLFFGNGGDINIIAFAGVGAGSGAITGTAGSPVQISAGGASNGVNGTVNLIAGGSGFTTINNIGDIDTTGGTGGGGDINIITATPLVSAGGVSVDNGQIVSGNFTPGDVQNGSINVGTLTGPGSIITVEAGNSALTRTVTNIGLGSNVGGTFKLTENSSLTLQVQPGAINGVDGTINVNGGPGAGGGGGTIILHNKGTGGIALNNTANLQFQPGIGGGAGGTLIAKADNGNLTIQSSTLNANASGPGNYDGGKIKLVGQNINVTGGSIILTANGVGTGNGGQIIVIAKAGSINIGGAGNISQISATGGMGNGSTGGNVLVSAGSSLTVKTTINVTSLAANGNGGNITLAAGSAVPGVNLNIGPNGILGTDLNTAGTGSGAGGNLALISSGNIILDGQNSNDITTRGGEVNIIAGANFTVVDCSTVNVQGASSTGGFIRIDSAGYTISTDNTASSSNADGGDINIVAFNGSQANSGLVNSGNKNLILTTGGSNAGINGDVQIFIGHENSNNSYLGTINTAGANGGEGNVYIATAAPVIENGPLSIKNARIISGNIAQGAIQASNIVTRNITTNSGNVTIVGGNNVTTGAINTGVVVGSDPGFGNSGSVNISSSGGGLTLSSISTNGFLQGNFAGNITLSAPTFITMDALNANGYIGSTGGAISITTPGQIGGTIINAVGSLGGNAGSITTNSGTLNLTGVSVLGQTIDASSGGGNGGRISITTTSSATFFVGGTTNNNGVAANITANGANGGFITLTNYGNAITGNQIINANVQANGDAGLGGRILFQGNQPPGTGSPLTTTIFGLVQANNTANNSGIIGFNGGPGGGINLLGTGIVNAGDVIRIGNLDPNTLAFISPPAGLIFVSPTLRLSNRVEPPLTATFPGTNIPTTVPDFFNLSKTAVDYTPFHRFPYIDRYKYPEPTYQLAIRNTVLATIPGAKIYDHNFDNLQKNGLVLGNNSSKNYLNIKEGNVLLRPDKNIIVSTGRADLYVSGGAIAFVMVANSPDSKDKDVIVYDLSQNRPRQVSVVVNKRKLFLEPGLMLVLTGQETSDFENINADCHFVNYCNARAIKIDQSDVRAFLANFSHASAILTMSPLQKLLASTERKDKSTLNEIAKTASIMGGFFTEVVPVPAQIASKPMYDESGTQAIHPRKVQIGSKNNVTK